MAVVIKGDGTVTNQEGDSFNLGDVVVVDETTGVAETPSGESVSTEGSAETTTQVADGQEPNDAVNVKQLATKVDHGQLLGVASVVGEELGSFTATAGQTSFTVADGYTAGKIAVFKNGIFLATDKYTATDESKVVLAEGALVNDVIKVTGFNATSNVSVSGGGSLSKPDAFSVLFTKVSPDSIKVPAGFSGIANGHACALVEDVTLSLTANIIGGVAPVAGNDYYVAIKSDGTLHISPTNEPGADYGIIGGFHYSMCPHDEAPTGNKTEEDMVNVRGINAFSMWDLKWRPASKRPEGMFLAGDQWYDIYLADAAYANRGYALANGDIAGGAESYGRLYPIIPKEYGGDGTINYGSLTWYEANEIAKSAGKELISYNDYPTVAYGVVEAVSADTADTGKNIHLANHMSIFGMEAATGVQYIWSADVGGNRDEGSTTWAWHTDLTEGRGDMYMLHANHLTALLLASSRSSGSGSGSRVVHANHYVRDSSWSFGVRCKTNHLVLV